MKHEMIAMLTAVTLGLGTASCTTPPERNTPLVTAEEQDQVQGILSSAGQLALEIFSRVVLDEVEDLIGVLLEPTKRPG